MASPSPNTHNRVHRMNDKELLELAAKAVGLKYHAFVNDIMIGFGLNIGDYETPIWNPLTDDGDALRLAVKLMDFEPYMSRGVVPFIKNDMVATRRAIVRAAAEIGKTK